MIDVHAQNVRLWVNEHKRDDGKVWYTYAISTSSKDQDGNYINKPLEVRMRKDAILPAELKNGQLVDIMGSISNRKFTDRDGNERIEHLLWAAEIRESYTDAPRRSEPAENFSTADDILPF